LNSSVYRARVAFFIVYPSADSQLRDTFRGGKITVLRSQRPPGYLRGSVSGVQKNLFKGRIGDATPSVLTNAGL